MTREVRARRARWVLVVACFAAGAIGCERIKQLGGDGGSAERPGAVAPTFPAATPAQPSQPAPAATALPVTTGQATYKVGPKEKYTRLRDVRELLKPGDIVDVMGDATYDGDIGIYVSGTPDKKIVLRGVRVNGKRPILKGGSTTIEINGNHFIVEGFEITEGTNRCFFHHGHDITLRDTVIHDCPGHGLLGADEDSGSLTMEYVEVYGCGAGERQHQIYMATDERSYPGSVFRMQHCYVHSAKGGNNVKSRAERNEIYFNWIEGGYYHELELIGPDGEDEKLVREDGDVVGNVLLKTGDGYVARLGGDGTASTSGRYRFVNNTIVTLGHRAVFRMFERVESLEASNNVFFRSGDDAPWIVREEEAKWVNGRSVKGSNNWVEEGSTHVPDEWEGTITGKDPGFLGLDKPDLRPKAGGPLVDAGTDKTVWLGDKAIPKPLLEIGFEPPLRTIEPARPRVKKGAIDLGPFELR